MFFNNVINNKKGVKDVKKILLSIIVPVYNVEKYIEKCINSLLNELDECIEIIIVDDCTQDNSIKKCENLIKGFKNVNIIKREYNGGLSAARNTGIEMANGKYCWFVDSDDYIVPGALKEIIHLLKYTNDELILFNHLRVDETGKQIYQSGLKGENIRISNFEDRIEFVCKYLKNDYGFEVWRKIFSLDIIKRNQIKFEPNKEIFAEDICFLLYYISYCENISIKPDTYYCYLIRENSIMGQKQIKVNEMINLSYKVYSNIKDEKMKDYIDLIMFRLLEIELNSLNRNIELEYIYKISNKEFTMKIISNPFNNIKLRIKMFGKKSAINQILIAKRIKAALENNRMTYSLYYNFSKVIECKGVYRK